MGLSCWWRKWALSQVWLRVADLDGAVGDVVAGDGADGALLAAGAAPEDGFDDSRLGWAAAFAADRRSFSWTTGSLSASISAGGAGWGISGLLQNSAG